MDKKPIIFRVEFNNILRNCGSKMRGDIPAWNELIDTAHQFIFESSPDPVVVTVDWKNTKGFIDEQIQNTIYADKIKTQEDYDVMIQEFNEYRRLVSIGLIRTSLEIEFSVHNPPENSSSNSGYVVSALYQIFLAMNLSVPGSCDFYSAIIYPMQSPNENISDNGTKLLLSGSILEELAELSEELKWAKIHDISVKKTFLWMQRIGLTKDHFASSNTERAIFGMLYSCQQNDFHPSILIPLAQALEALFNTPEAGISKALRERAFLVLGEPNENRKKIQKAINSFYGYRSKYVHGGVDIPNPMSTMLEDKSVDKIYEELNNHKNIAMLLLVASLQKLIIEDGDEFIFSETVLVSSQVKKDSEL